VSRRLAAGLFTLALVAGCGRPAAPLSAAIVPPTASAKALITVTGFSSTELSSLGRASLTPEQWRALVRVSVDRPGEVNPTIAGQYRVTSTGIDFLPAFPFDPGRAYVVDVDASRLPTPRSDAIVRTVVSLPADSRLPSTTVTRMLPTSPVLPDNLLRIYLEFSAPMSREHGRDFLSLVDEHGNVVTDALLALDVDLWSPDGRRYTVFLDPGRVKRGILPNDQFGRALKPGHRFALVVDPKWRDEHGQPLAAPFRQEFNVGPADMSPIRTSDWKVHPARAASREPLIVTFPKPLDHGLLSRALGVERGGQSVAGEITIGPNETAWRFTPTDGWTPGAYDLVVLSILEDPMGNRIGRAFDIDSFKEIDKSPAPDRTTLPFVVR
jgi:hypothetical protein